MPLVVVVSLVIDRIVNAKSIFGVKVVVRTKTMRFGSNQGYCC